MNEFDNPVERQVEHRGHTIVLTREKCLGGWTMTYYTVWRDSDGYECTTNFSDSEETLDDWVQILKDRIDAELADEDPWGEHQKAHP